MATPLEMRIAEVEAQTVAQVKAAALAYAYEDLQTVTKDAPSGLSEHQKLDALMTKLRGLYMARLAVEMATPAADPA